MVSQKAFACSAIFISSVSSLTQRTFRALTLCSCREFPKTKTSMMLVVSLPPNVTHDGRRSCGFAVV